MLAADTKSLLIKDLASLEGARDNQLLGYGLVVGLNGTGDKRQTFFSTQSLANLLERMGVQVNPTALLVRNVASVMVTATLPPYGQNGTRIDVTVAAIGDAQNLQGGILIQTPLRGANGTLYAVAQGPVITGGFVAGGRGNSQTVNHPTVGRIVGGGLIEQDAPSLAPGSTMKLQLQKADFRTAVQIAEAVNRKFGMNGATGVATAQNAAAVLLRVPKEYEGREVEFFAEIEAVPLSVERRPKVVINERTGTIVIGKDVAIRPIAILHGALSIEISTSFITTQPQPLSNGQTTVVPQVGVGVREEKAKSVSLGAGATVDELVQALKQIGSTARDVIAILQALKAGGALDAELEVL
jgi:flagellar P-ring protein precursor FlgI